MSHHFLEIIIVVRIMRGTKYQRYMEEYGEEYLRRMAEEGYTDSEIANMSGVPYKTFRRWRDEHEEFQNALKLGRFGSDFAVIEALYKKATGYSVTVNKTYKLKRVDYDPDTGKKIREYEELQTGADDSYIPADVRAMSFWLKSRQPSRWSEKVDSSAQEPQGAVDIPIADTIDEYNED